jgi:hypothetical protein
VTAARTGAGRGSTRTGGGAGRNRTH